MAGAVPRDGKMMLAPGVELKKRISPFNELSSIPCSVAWAALEGRAEIPSISHGADIAERSNLS
jgi:hypothetical protein